MDKRLIRDSLRLVSALLFFFLYIPHYLCFIVSGGGEFVLSDLKRYTRQVKINMPIWIFFIYMLHNNRYYRSLFYYRIGPVWSLLISWYRPGDRYFTIAKDMPIGGGLLMAHPYATILNAESIGCNFSCLHCTTIGKTSKGRPVIGDNVSLGANVTIVGPVHIGNNVTVGAGSVIVKDVPDNCVVVGNPQRIVKFL